MRSDVRVAVAAIALSHARGAKIYSIYDYSRAGYVPIDAECRGGRVDGYDYSNGSHIDGNLPALFHYGEGCHIDVEQTGAGRYEGFEYGTGSHFEITVQGNDAELYDYGAGGWFSFST